MEETLQEIETEHGIPPADILSVSDLNTYIADKVDTDPELADIYILGEVSNCSHSSRNHVFFDLKDDDAAVSCVIFSNTYQQLDCELEDGDQVLVKGTAEFYNKNGSISVKVRNVLPVGDGIYYQQLRKRIKKLRKEGLFEDKHKQSIPELPERIGVVTSTEGAAVQDIIDAIHDRYPAVDIFLRHAAVQGKHAEDDIINGIQFFDNQFDVDVIVVGRGGGSIEDLQAFNQESVAREIFNADTPIVSGVGHRTDETITGYIADRGAITPTAAGKAAVPDKTQLLRELENLETELDDAIKQYETQKEQKKQLDIALSRERKYQVALAASVSLNIALLWWIL